MPITSCDFPVLGSSSAANAAAATNETLNSTS